ncbi:hypothetical protein KZX46_21750 (plasmid) [Polymorphobacter sp. PAMC 29334]|uniref:hypothetical protein n=1 Tax=Polymorphobacter sp. PAMC 29334 TaxID=2862331 RepID=UPI001C7510D6|nr:hypothetical protein [Polymorphobacter sp. PAMC 29334]QYE37259.1 hypothetical protein KZX46_21750 [Polymorphobacter sp. PAMC 29334]
MATIFDEEPLDLREQIARIDQLLADAARKRQEVRIAPWQIVVTSLGAGAAIFAAGAGFIALILKVG